MSLLVVDRLEAQTGRWFVSAEEKTAERANLIVIPKLEFDNTPFKEALEILRRESRIHDPQKRGVTIEMDAEVVAVSGREEGRGTKKAVTWPNFVERKITMSLANMPVEEALKYITVPNLKVVATATGFLVVLPSMSVERLETCTISLPPQLFGKTASAEEFGVNQVIVNRLRSDPQEFLTEVGMLFPRGASCSFHEEKLELVVANSAEQMNLFESLLRDLIPPEVPGPEVPKWSDPCRKTRERAEKLILSKVFIFQMKMPEAIRTLNESISRWESDRSLGVSLEGVEDPVSIPGLGELPGRPPTPWFTGNEISYMARGVSLLEAASEIARLAGGELNVDEFRLRIDERQQPSLVTWEYRVPPDFLRERNDDAAPPEWLLQAIWSYAGIRKGISANYTDSTLTLTVRNSLEEQEKIKQLVEKNWREYYASGAWPKEQRRQQRLRELPVNGAERPN